jgi:HAD superfamily hydrolase (TIGR01509 family)
VKPSALIFDFFGVICSEISPFWFEEHFAKNGRELQVHYSMLSDRGDITQEELLTDLSRMSGIPPQEIEKDWLTRARFNTKLIELIKDCKPKYKIGLLTNATSPFFRMVLTLSGIAELFDSIVVSSEIRHAKPDPEIYEAILSQLSLVPAQALFIDDNPRNVQGAQRVGMSAHVYKSVEDLRELLKTV